MTPDEANALWKFSQDYPRRVRRYELEGGTRRCWTCSKCGCATEAHTEVEANTNLTSYGKERVEAALCDGNHVVTAGCYMPPMDFT